MKKSNIAFSGFMAAILVSVGAANAATTQIASKQYVDNKVGSVQQSVTQVQNQYTTINETVTQLGDTINNEESGLTQQIENITQQIGDSSAGLVKDVNDLETSVGGLQTTVGNAESGLVKDVTDLKGQVGTLDTEMDSKLDSATATATYEVLTNKTNDLATDAGSTDKYPSAKAVVDWVSNTVTEGIEINTDKIQNGAITTDKLGDGAVSTDKIANDAVNGDKIADDSIGAEHIKDGAVNSDAIADGSVTGTDIADATISAGKLDTALNAEIDGKEDKSNKAAVIDSSNQASTDAYPSVKAVYDWTTQQIANVEFDPSTDLGDGAVSGDKITDGTITGDKIADDAIDSDAIADNAVGTGQIQNGAVTGDKIADGAVDSAAIADGSVTEADLNTDLASKINGKQDRNVGADNSGKILTVGADGNITTSATIAQSAVDGLDTALDAKAAADDLDDLETRVGLAENDIDALQTTVGSSTDGLVADVAALQKTASTLGTTYEQIANRTDTLDDATTASKYPTAGAVRSYVASEIAALDDTGLPVNPGNIEDGSLPGSKLQDGAITTDKIANGTILKEDLNSALQTEIDGKADLADVYTRQQTNDKIVEIAIQQPQNTCTSESDLCVLTLTKDKRLAWVPVTEPATAPVIPTHRWINQFGDPTQTI